MIRTLDARALGVDAVVRALERPPSRVPADVSATVDEILAAVRTRGDAAVLDRIELPSEDARRLMELGFLPGTRITAGLSAPGGVPRVFRVDGSEIALRRETAKLMKVRLTPKIP